MRSVAVSLDLSELRESDSHRVNLDMFAEMTDIVLNSRCLQLFALRHVRTYTVRASTDPDAQHRCAGKTVTVRRPRWADPLPVARTGTNL